MAVLAPIKWYAKDCILARKSPELPATNDVDRAARRREAQFLKQAEQNGYFTNLTRNFLISKVIQCQLPSEDSSKYQEVNVFTHIFRPIFIFKFQSLLNLIVINTKYDYCEIHYCMLFVM